MCYGYVQVDPEVLKGNGRAEAVRQAATATPPATQIQKFIQQRKLQEQQILGLEKLLEDQRDTTQQLQDRLQALEDRLANNCRAPVHGNQGQTSFGGAEHVRRPATLLPSLPHERTK